MWRVIKILITGIAVSFYFFPFEFVFLPGVNTKMAMAGIGLIVYVLSLAKVRSGQINKDGFNITVCAILVSLCGFASVILNNTNDYTYATYVVSMFVWMGGAYIAIRIVKLTHGYISVELLANYLIGVCVGQCVIALMIDYIPSFKSIVDTYVAGFDFIDINRLSKSGRLYGIGAASDVAGTRFAVVLIVIAFLVQRMSDPHHRGYLGVYLTAFLFISVVGNMLARTTTVGVIMSLIYWGLSSIKPQSTVYNKLHVWKYVTIALCICLPIIVYLYSVDDQFHNSIRFAFEGFFSLVESGKWETNSNNILKDMIVFPESLKTWIIGDGYFENPYHTDPYFIGVKTGGFYMGTDIGYLRFIFYFGVLGLASFVLFFIKVFLTLAKRYPYYMDMFVMILLLNFIIWFKVSTDIFVVFALLLCVDTFNNNDKELVNDVDYLLV